MHQFARRRQRARRRARKNSRSTRLPSARPHLDSGATEANNMVMHHLREARRGGEVWLPRLSIRACLIPRIIISASGQTHSCHADGVIDLDWLTTNSPMRAARCGDAANNETASSSRGARPAPSAINTKFPFHRPVQFIGKMPMTAWANVISVSARRTNSAGRARGFFENSASQRHHAAAAWRQAGRRPALGTENVRPSPRCWPARRAARQIAAASICCAKSAR